MTANRGARRASDDDGRTDACSPNRARNADAADADAADADAADAHTAASARPARGPLMRVRAKK